MTEADVIAHWQQGARDALIVAQAAHEKEKYALAIFNAHFAVEKALKAKHMQEHKKDAPFTHDLFSLAQGLSRTWTAEEKKQLAYLTEYAVAARYHDAPWALREATEENSKRWLAISEGLLSSLLS